MANTTLNFNFELNVSLQAGDIVYYLDSNDSIIRLGPCVSFGTNSITCDTGSSSINVPENSFIFFGKDNEINTSGILGYYAEVEFVNESDQYAELFAVNSEIFISSN